MANRGGVFVPPPNFFNNKTPLKKKRNLHMTPVHSSKTLALRATLSGQKPKGKRSISKKNDFNNLKKNPQFLNIEPEEEEIDIDDFNTLLTKRLVQNLDNSEVGKGNYTVKKGSYCLIIQQQEPKRHFRSPQNVKDIDKKVKNFEDMLPGPYTLGHVREEEKTGQFNIKDILKFEQMYKKDLYDTFIKIGEYYQAPIPEKDSVKSSFFKNRTIFGLPPFGMDLSEEVEQKINSPNKLVVEVAPDGSVNGEKFKTTEDGKMQLENTTVLNSEESTSDGDGKHKSRGSPFKNDAPQQENQATIPELKKKKSKKEKKKSIEESEQFQWPNQDQQIGSYIDHRGYPSPIIENLYIKKRSTAEFMEWDPSLAEDSEVIDMMDQVLDEFRGMQKNPITRQVLYDYMILCDLDKEKFLDHLEEDHIEFRRYIQSVLKRKR